MAHLIKPTQTRWIKDGKRVKAGTRGAKKVVQMARKWYACSVPGYPPKKRIPLASDKSVAQRMLANLIGKGERGEAGLEDGTTQARRTLLEEHLDDFQAHLEAKETSAKTIRLCLTRIRAVFDGCGFQFPQDIKKGAVETYLAQRRKDTKKVKGISIKTANDYIGAVKQFCSWMIDEERLATNPLRKLKKGNAALDRRHDRRNIEPEQLEALLDATATNKKTFRGLAGVDRHALYLAACGTGFRVSELASLTPASFDLDADPATVTLPAKKGKSKKKTDVHPLPRAVADALRDYLKGKPKTKPVWGGTWHEKAAPMLYADLEVVGIPSVIDGPDGPLYADFHALRHTYISLMERSGISPKTAQVLARHSDIRLTMNRYTHADRKALAEAVDKLPVARSKNPDELTPEEQFGILAATAFAVCDSLVGLNLSALVAHMVAHFGGMERDGVGLPGQKGSSERPAGDT